MQKWQYNMRIKIINKINSCYLGIGFRIDKGFWNEHKFIDIYYSFKNKRIIGISIDY